MTEQEAWNKKQDLRDLVSLLLDSGFYSKNEILEDVQDVFDEHDNA